ncbi:MAG: hypothetical protein IPL25_03480 [Saprospiraceae bacterium]|nr:hypothetical protein [Candidatus Vicinibacter affinis]
MLETKLLLRLTMLSALVLALGAIAGGLSLMMAPDGSILEMPISLLKDTPFVDFFYPGLILFVCIGLFSSCIFITIILTSNISPFLVAAQGLILFIWMVVQIWMVGYHSLIQLIFLLFGIKIMVYSWVLHYKTRPK